MRFDKHGDKVYDQTDRFTAVTPLVITMEDITPEAFHLIEENAPTFITAVRRAREHEDTGQDPVTILLSLDAFYDDPILLYACIWYCTTLGVACTFVPIAASPKLSVRHK